MSESVSRSIEYRAVPLQLKQLMVLQWGVDWLWVVSKPILVIIHKLMAIVQKNLLCRKGIGIQNFFGPSSYSFGIGIIPLKGKESQHLAEF